MTPVQIQFSPTQLEAKRTELALVSSAAAGLQVRSAEDAIQATELLRAVKAEAKALEEMRTSVKRPLVEAGRQLDSWFRSLSELLDRAEKALKSAVGAWQVEERRRYTAAFTAAAEAHAAADHAAVQSALIQASACSTTAPQGTTIREVWQATIVDPGAVPRAWCVPDEVRIRASARVCPPTAQPKPIPGVEYRLTSAMTVR